MLITADKFSVQNNGEQKIDQARGGGYSPAR